MPTIYFPDINSKHGDGHAVLDAAWAAGERIVAIKAGGDNVGLYQAPHYAEQVAYARKKGFAIIHYFVSGNASIAGQAAEAIAIIKPNWRDGDAFAWDNEQLDSTGQIRNDPDSALLINTVRGSKGLNCPGGATWIYGSAGSTFRAHGPWPKVKATGAQAWVAAYPGPPDMSGTGLTTAVHQFTSSWPYGDGELTDRNKTTRTIAQLFPKRSPAPVKPASSTVPKTTTGLTGSPGKMPSNCWKRMQLLGSLAKAPHKYVGPKDGVLGTLSWTGIQGHLTDLGFYHGDIDGEPKRLTFVALQKWAGSKSPTVTDDYSKISRANWRLIGRKLNTL